MQSLPLVKTGGKFTNKIKAAKFKWSVASPTPKGSSNAKGMPCPPRRDPFPKGIPSGWGGVPGTFGAKLPNLPLENTKIMKMFTKEEIKELFAETDKRIDRLAERQEKTDEQLAKTDALLNKVAAKMDKMNEMYGGLGNNVGQATEELFFNTLTDNPVLKQIRFDRPQRNWHNVVGKCEDEYDLVMKNDDLSIFILEVKFKASLSDVEKLLTTKQENFNILFPEYKEYDQHWGLAATIIDEELKDMAVNNGLTVLQYKGELIQHNPPTRPEEIRLIGA